MDYKETIWVTGCKGFLGREIVKRLKATYNCTVVGTDKELMVTDPERIEAFAQDLRPDVVINCAGICLRSQRSWRSQRCACRKQCWRTYGADLNR